MTQKTVHIVFQVLNFLRDLSSRQYKLLPIDKLILITLASHKGTKGIFPMQETLADELGIKRRHLRYRLNHLEKIGLIVIEKVGRKHHYHLQKLSTIEALECTYQESIEAPQCTSQGHYSAAHRGTVVATNNKVSNKLNKTERERTKRAPLSLDDFCPNEANQYLCSDLRLNLEEEVTSFKNRHNGKGELQYEFGRWLKRSQEYANAKRAKNGHAQEVRSTVPEWGPGHETYDRIYSKRSQEVKKEILTPLVEVEYESYADAKKRYELSQQQGGLTNAAEISRNNGRGTHHK